MTASIASFQRWLIVLLALSASLSLASFAQGLVPVPELKAHVTDTVGLLRADERSSLESALARYEERKGTQIAILIVSSTEPEAIEQYGIRVADAWKVGRKGTADGVILIVAKDNPAWAKRLRLEVGRGLEGAIPDAIASRILAEDIAPHFRQNDWYGGLAAGIARIEGVLEGEALPPPQRTAQAQRGGVSGWFPIVLFLFFGLMAILGRIGRGQVTHLGGNRSRFGAGNVILPAVLGGMLGSASRGGGFGSGFGGGGFGGGGFSGGGGDFGGGGASGNW